MSTQVDKSAAQAAVNGGGVMYQDIHNNNSKGAVQREFYQSSVPGVMKSSYASKSATSAVVPEVKDIWDQPVVILKPW